MARTILTVLLIVASIILVGCVDGESGKLQLRPLRLDTLEDSEQTATETDLVEQIISSRMKYRQGMEAIVKHYTEAGDYMKLRWAQKELCALSVMPQYNYIVEAGLAGPGLKATESIAEADDLYNYAVLLEENGKGFLIFRDENKLRLALDNYNKLIRKYPTSDKIDDAAFKAGGIHEAFQDYLIAVLYYKRAFQWDPQTEHPAMYKAAYILDRRLHRQAQEALELYKEAVRNENLSLNYMDFAEWRIEELTKSDKKNK